MKPGEWEVSFFAAGTKEVLVVVDGNSGEITESWTGEQVAWPMARGHEGQFGHLLNAPYVWIPMALIFFFALFDFRNPRRIAHLDLLVLLSFGISHAFFNSADIGVSVPLYYPPLIYLLVAHALHRLQGQHGGAQPVADEIGAEVGDRRSAACWRCSG